MAVFLVPIFPSEIDKSAPVGYGSKREPAAFAAGSLRLSEKSSGFFRQKACSLLRA